MAAAAKGKKKQQKKYDDTNRGVLFQNDKGDNEARPDYTGNLKINPADFEDYVDEDGLLVIRLAAWVKESDRVGDYLSITASPMH